MSDKRLTTPHGSVTIRSTREDDAVAYRELRLEALRSHPEVYGMHHDAAAAQPDDYWRAAMRKGADGPTGVTYVAESEQDLVGMAVLSRETGVKVAHSASIYSVYVQPTWRRTGVADALIGACVDWARAAGLRLVKLSVVATNAAALRLYLRCGFSIYGVEPEVIAWDGRYYDELLLYRRLV